MRSSTPNPWSLVVRLAEQQDALLRKPDLLALGLHSRVVRRLVLAERLHELHPGVCALGHRAISRRAGFRAAVWWVGGDAALSHESGAEFYAWTPAGGPIHVTTTGDRVRSKPGVVVHRTCRLDHRDVVEYDGLRVTDRVRTLVDLADHLADDELRAIADELPALPKRRLLETAARLPGRAGAGRTHRLIHSADAKARFAMERRSVTYFAAHDVPEPERNVRVHGVLVDCWYPGARFVVELDSRSHHAREQEMEQDRQRDRALERQGIRTMRLMWHDLDPADPLAARDVLLQLGRGSR